LAAFFDIADGFWTQGRLTDEAVAVRQKKEAAAANGRASALKRKARHSTKRNARVNEATNEASTKKQLNHNHTQEEKTEPKGSSKKLLPDDWRPQPFGEGSEAAAIVAAWPDGESDRQAERFRDHHLQHGNRFSDWQAAWGKWVRNSVQFSRSQPVGRGNPDYSIIDQVLEEAERRKKVATG
jgi:hypothetical protein